MKIFNFEVNTYSISLCIGILLSASSACSQKTFINKTQTHYQWNGKNYTFSEMEHIFSSNETQLKYYKDAIVNIKTAKALGLVSLGSLISGTIIAIKSFDLNLSGLCFSSCTGTYSPPSNQRMGSSVNGVLLLISIITGPVATGYKSKGIKLKKSLIELYNQELRQLEKSELDLSFGPTTNGIGFIFKF